MEANTQEDTSPVSLIPAEILAKIFTLNISFLPAQRGHYYRLFNTLFVCRCWYQVTVSTPHLWCHLGSNINLWPLFARRSKNLDLFIHMYDILGEYRMTVQEEFDTMFKDTAFHQRIREITFDGDPATFTRLFDQAPIHPPRLTSLSFMNGLTSLTTPRAPVGFITPCLQKFEIVDLDLNLDSITSTHNLTHLSLTIYKGIFSGSGRIIALLQENPRLEYFRLISVFDGTPLEGGPSHVPLPHLRTLDMKLFWTTSQFSRFLECLELSTNIEEIKLATSYPGGCDNLAWGFNAVYPAMSPDLPQHLMVRESSPKDTACHYRKHLSEDASFPQTAPFLTLRSDDILKSSRHDYLGELEKHNVLSNLTHLEVRVFRWKPHLRPVFEMTKSLEKLTVWTWGYCRGLFRDLHPEVVGDDAESADTTKEGNSTSPAGVWLPLPTLRELTIVEAEFHNTDPERLPSAINVAFSCFSSRKQHGSPLDVLKFLGCRYDGPNLDWIEELEESIQEVFWEVFEDTSCDEETESSECDRVSISDEGEEEDNYFLHDHCLL